ncbi:hypothetical protein PIB30_046743 [Stylosanthes scabra]|uniref:F-box domain-containing protein n=1 Tax=Stylosanthes scabra TaxID=79078 RepID=A0ABU6SGE0_9FABA|nr:hypothetical protein [Stylosanthes scabra]
MRDDVLGDEDLLTEILLRLLVKDALRCKCVCKKWKSLISDPQFCYRHNLRLCRKTNPNTNTNPCLYPSGMLFQESVNLLRNKKGHVVPFTNNSNNRFIHLNAHTNFEGTLNYHILQSCNGLLLWDSTPIPWPSRPYSAEANKILQRCYFFYVSNPSTGHCVRIDQFGYPFRPPFSSVFLVFEPWKSPHYKVIFFEIILKRKLKMCVYSSETGSWSKLDVLSHPPPTLFCFPKPAVYCNGAIHWFELGDNFVISVYFDIDQLCFKNIPVLPIPAAVMISQNQMQVMHFGESGGILYLITKKSYKYDIWELKEDYSRWILKYNVDPTKNNLVRNSLIHVAPLRVVCQPPNEDGEEESVFVILIVEQQKLVSYNLKDHSAKILHQEDRFSPPHLKEQYFETLASI